MTGGKRAGSYGIVVCNLLPLGGEAFYGLPSSTRPDIITLCVWLSSGGKIWLIPLCNVFLLLLFQQIPVS